MKKFLPAIIVLLGAATPPPHTGGETFTLILTSQQIATLDSVLRQTQAPYATTQGLIDEMAKQLSEQQAKRRLLQKEKEDKTQPPPPPEEPPK